MQFMSMNDENKLITKKRRKNLKEESIEMETEQLGKHKASERPRPILNHKKSGITKYRLLPTGRSIY
jgi:hypothetical protein